jgi:type IV pilus assembly protein PilF
VRQSSVEYDQARELFYQGKTHEALDHVKKALAYDEKSAPALYFASVLELSFCVNALGVKSPDCNLVDSEKYARLALEANPGLFDARNTLGAILILEKKFAEAIAVLEPLTKESSYEAGYLAWANLGWAQVLGGNVDEGIASLANSVGTPKFCVGQYRLGIAYEKKGDLEKSESFLTHAVTVESRDCQNLQDAWEARARVRVKLGKVADARSDFEKCRDISAGSPAGKTCNEALTAAQAPQ